MLRGIWRFGAGWTVLACLAACVGFAATVASSASAALPEYVECQKVKGTGAFTNGSCTKPDSRHTGKYELTAPTRACVKLLKGAEGFTGAFDDSACSEPDPEHKGHFELTEGVVKGKPFKGRLSGGAEFAIPEHFFREVHCLGGKDQGVVTGATTLNRVVISLTGCEMPAFGKCNSAGAARGEIDTAPLSGSLGYIDASTHSVGVDLSGEGGAPFAEFSCEFGMTIRIVGSDVIEITGEQLEVFGKVFELRSSAAEALEGGPIDRLEWEGKITEPEFSEPEPAPLLGSFNNRGEKLRLNA